MTNEYKRNPFVWIAGWTANAVTVSMGWPCYYSGQEVIFKAATNNTSAATINIDWRWAKSIKKFWTAALASWDITTWMLVHLRFDGTNFQMINTPWTENADVGPTGATGATGATWATWATGADSTVTWPTWPTGATWAWLTWSAQDYTVSNYTTARTFDWASTALADTNNALGTLIDDLIDRWVLS